MRTAGTIFLMMCAAVTWARPDPQEGEGKHDGHVTTAPEKKPEDATGPLVKAAELRSRVRDMRKTVLGGGPAVEKAEREALGFYRRKLAENAARTDELRTNRDVLDAEYRIALDETLKAEDEQARDSAARKAASLRGKIAAIDGEFEDLRRQRAALGNAIAAIQARIQHRKRIATHFDAGEADDRLPYLGEDVLGPDDDTAGAGDPFADDGFFKDLLRRDPERARSILFARDTTRYWELFPLAPPIAALRRALTFPAPDFPGRR